MNSRPNSPAASTRLMLLAALLAGGASSAAAIEKMRPYQHPTYYSQRATNTRIPESFDFDDFVMRLAADETGGAAASQPAGEAPAIDAPPQALHGGVTYWLFSDYVTRGVNLSDYVGEGGETPVHQLTTSLDFDLASGFGLGNEGDLGVLSFSTFFSWFPHYDRIATDVSSFQEYDLNLSYSYEFKPLATTATIGTSFFLFPGFKQTDSVELLFRLDHNDAWMWKWLWPENEDGVFNPYLSYAADIDYFNGGAWFEFGVSHDFPVIENLTVTPALTLGTDVRYLDRVVGTGDEGNIQLAYAQYALTVGYDLSAALDLPESAGTWVVSGFIYFNQTVGGLKRKGIIDDELFGGVSIGWSF